MSKPRKSTIYCADFETTVFEGQTSTEVWSAAEVPLGSEAVTVDHSIGEWWDRVISRRENQIIYFHNLKFDGQFILSYFMDIKKYEQALITGPDGTPAGWESVKDMRPGTFSLCVSDLGQWYFIRFKNGKYLIEIRDSLKLLPFSLAQIGKAFDTKHKKLSMKYEGERFAGCEITREEMEYIKNDVLVLSEALAIMFAEGHNKLTIGACCLSEFNAGFSPSDRAALFPDLTKIELDPEQYGAENADQYIRRAYKGGWCYCVEEKAGKIYHDGLTADWNSLYPSVMISQSGNAYPVGRPEFWRGNYFPKKLIKYNYLYYYIRFKCNFEIKKDMLPFIQIKGTWMYHGTDMLRTSDIINPKNKRKFRELISTDGELIHYRPTLTLSKTDFELFLKHYNITNFEVLDGCIFATETALFDGYINKYKKIKMESKGAKRTLAKLFLNNLYGKMAASTESSFKYAILGGDRTIHYIDVPEFNKRAGFIAIGAAVTAYARRATIEAAQKNYHGPDKPGFIYADTDSLHCDLAEDELIDIPIHPTEFCHFKIETHWDEGYFLRQKTYIERVTVADGEEVGPYYNITCAGLPKRCKSLLDRSLRGEPAREDEPEEFKKFLSEKRDITDFKEGLQIPGKLLPIVIPGGVVLKETTFTVKSK